MLPYSFSSFSYTLPTSSLSVKIPPHQIKGRGGGPNKIKMQGKFFYFVAPWVSTYISPSISATLLEACFMLTTSTIGCSLTTCSLAPVPIILQGHSIKWGKSISFSTSFRLRVHVFPCGWPPPCRSLFPWPLHTAVRREYHCYSRKLSSTILLSPLIVGTRHCSSSMLVSLAST